MTVPALVRYVVALSVFGLTGVIAFALIGPLGDVDFAITGALLLALVLSIWTPLRFQRRGGVQGFTLEVGVFVAMLFTVPTALVPAVFVTGAILGHVLLRPPPIKLAFNIGHGAVMATAGAVVFGLLTPGDPTSVHVLAPRSLAAVLVATALFDLVDVLSLAELFRRLEKRRYRETLSDVYRLYAVTWIGNTSFGLLLAFVARVDPIATLLASTLMVGLYLGYRGYAGVLEERQRAERLHDVTRSLVDATGSPEAMYSFLDNLTELFGGESAELLLVDGASRKKFRLGPEGFVQEELAGVPDGPLGETLRRSSPLLVHAGDASFRAVLEGLGHRDALAAPLEYESRTVGAIAVYDRHGLEPWDDTDATLLSSLANEAAVALKNVELFAAVERERALLAEQSTKLSDIVNAASDGIAMVDADGRIGAWNEAMGQVTGIEEGEALGQLWFVILRLRDAGGEDLPVDGPTALHAALRGEQALRNHDVQVLRRDGEWHWLRCSISPVQRQGMGFVGAVVVARDVTREREVEELKSDFIATVSHELRTPLTPLRGFLETLRAHSDALTPEQVDEVFEAMQGQLGRLEALVTDLLMVVDLERGDLRFRLEALDLADTVSKAVQPEARTGRIDVQADEWVGAIGDPAAVARIVRALVSNALKHTAGNVTVRLRPDGDRALVEVVDEGPGIPRWEQERVFQRFSRLGNYLHRTQGPGLGLSIAQALAQGVEGDLTLESDLENGSTFTLALPASTPRSSEAERPAPQRAAS